MKKINTRRTIKVLKFAKGARPLARLAKVLRRPRNPRSLRRTRVSPRMKSRKRMVRRKAVRSRRLPARKRSRRRRSRQGRKATWSLLELEARAKPNKGLKQKGITYLDVTHGACVFDKVNGGQKGRYVSKTLVVRIL